MDKYIGRLLDNRYEILEVLGTGGMAVVYKARCHRLNRLVAIKILKDDYLEDEEFRRRFHSESQAVAMFSHPNIVSVYDVSTSVTADYIVMELIEGITLKQYMEKKGVLNWKETLHFAIQIAKALEHAHSRGIVHRDIKPHNVMVLKNGSVKVTDFGIARMMSKGNTLTKEALGSVHYISPEQAKGGRVDSRSDIYSLGVVMYEMMTGRPPYDGESPVAVAIQHINGGAAMPSTLNPNIPGGLEQIIMRAMAHQLNDRYESSTQMLADMDEFRKNPTILFDYNTPPLDDVIKISKPPLVLDPTPPVTTAERVARRSQEQRRQPGQRRSAADEKSRQEARRRAEAAAEESRSRVATIAIIACSAVMVVAVVIFLIVLLGGGNVSQPKLIEVPDLIGMNYEALLEYPGFEIRLNEEVHDDEYEAGQIIEQNPKAGDMVADPNDIFVTVSLGPAPKTVYMPDLADKELEEAKRMLDNLVMNLNVVIKEEFHDAVLVEKVIRTDPMVAVELKTGQTVTLYVSKGPEIETTQMPDLRERPLEDARKILENKEMKLDISVEEVYDAEIAAGIVIKSSPEEGQELKTGQKVTITVSKGPQKAKVPDVRDRNIADAVSMLMTAGFPDYGIESEYSDVEKDRVIEQSVAPGEEIEVTTKIILKVSKGSAEETTKPVTKNVTIPLAPGITEGGECEVKVTRDGQLVFSQKVPQGTLSITLQNQTSDIPVKYVVIVNDQEGFDYWEEFKAG